MARRRLQMQADDLKQEVRQKEAEAARNRQVMEEAERKHREEVRGLQAQIDHLEQVEREHQETLRRLQARLHHEQEVAERNEQLIAQVVQIIEGFARLQADVLDLDRYNGRDDG